MLLTVKTRQKYLKALGYYEGEIDGIVGKLTKAAYKKLQDDYFTRKADRDGIYGKDTDTLLRNAYNVKLYTPNFHLSEFKCQCGGKYCTGYPSVLSVQLLKNVQAIRNKYGATTITSGMRCSKHNAVVGGTSGSRHKSGKAVDLYNATCRTEAGRKKIMEYWMTLNSSRYTYCNIGGNYPNMGNAVHCDVR